MGCRKLENCEGKSLKNLQSVTALCGNSQQIYSLTPQYLTQMGAFRKVPKSSQNKGED